MGTHHVEIGAPIPISVSSNALSANVDSLGPSRCTSSMLARGKMRCSNASAMRSLGANFAACSRPSLAPSSVIDVPGSTEGVSADPHGSRPTFVNWRARDESLPSRAITAATPPDGAAGIRPTPGRRYRPVLDASHRLVRVQAGNTFDPLSMRPVPILRAVASSRRVMSSRVAANERAPMPWRSSIAEPNLADPGVHRRAGRCFQLGSHSPGSDFDVAGIPGRTSRSRAVSICKADSRSSCRRARSRARRLTEARWKAPARRSSAE